MNNSPEVGSFSPSPVLNLSSSFIKFEACPIDNLSPVSATKQEVEGINESGPCSNQTNAPTLAKDMRIRSEIYVTKQIAQKRRHRGREKTFNLIGQRAPLGASNLDELLSGVIALIPAPRRKQQIYLFVNPTSGGNAAAAITVAGLEYCELHIEKSAYVQVWISSMFDGPSGNKPGFLSLKTSVSSLPDDEASFIYVIVAGGDGTVLWCTTEILKHGIDTKKIALAIIPYGTGNDFARALNWNNLGYVRPYERNLRTLRGLIVQWLASYLVFHDFWKIKVTLLEGGQFKKIDDKTRKKKMLIENNDSRTPLLKKSFIMSNYFSVGVDSRIGIGFDRNRSKNKAVNKMCYGLEGFKKSYFHKHTTINSIMEEMSIMDKDDEPAQSIFSTERTDPETANLYTCESLLAMNISSFMSGVDVWKNSQGRCGLVGNTANIGNLLDAEQRMGDGMLEWLSFRQAASFAFERVFKGRGRRIHQGRGAFRLKFKDLSPNFRCYFQVDGEFYQMTRPESITVRWFKRLKVLAHRDADLTRCVMFDLNPPLPSGKRPKELKLPKRVLKVRSLHGDEEDSTNSPDAQLQARAESAMMITPNYPMTPVDAEQRNRSSI